jgi:carboxynorspermidine decarboxylase
MRTEPQSIGELIESCRDTVPTPYYLLDETRLIRNLERISSLRSRTGVKSVLALKCFSTWSVFDLMRPYMDGTTASSPWEARLGAEQFGKEVHAYSVAFSDADIAAVRQHATTIIFNSVSQLERFRAQVPPSTSVGLRINPGTSYSHYDLADPGRPFSRLGAGTLDAVMAVSGSLNGVMFHNNCENDSLDAFREMLGHVANRFGRLLQQMEWVSLGGGISFTGRDYPFDAFCDLLAEFGSRFRVQVYLEPGSAAVSGAGFLVTQVLDVVHNGLDIAIVDAAAEAHMLDLLVYGMTARVEGLEGAPGRSYMVAGRSCLAGDVFGTYEFPEPLGVGSLIAFADAADYTMVKKNWFNGLAMPSIVVRRLDGRVDVVRTFDYHEYVASLS